MSRPQMLQYLDENWERAFEASIRTFATNAVGELIRSQKLDPIHAQACGDWMTHMLRADFHAERASDIASENKLNESLLREALESILKRTAENVPE